MTRRQEKTFVVSSTFVRKDGRDGLSVSAAMVVVAAMLGDLGVGGAREVLGLIQGL